MKKQSKPMSEQAYLQKDHTKMNGDMQIQQAQLQKLLETTYAEREIKEKKFEKVVEDAEFLPILIMWLIHILLIGFGVFFYFKQPDAVWHLFVFGIPAFMLSWILLVFLWMELDSRKVYWREIK